MLSFSSCPAVPAMIWSASFVTTFRQERMGCANASKDSFHCSDGSVMMTEHSPLHNISLSSVAICWQAYGIFQASKLEERTGQRVAETIKSFDPKPDCHWH